MLRYCGFALLSVLVALLAAACADSIAEAPQRYTQRLELERAPLESQYSTGSLSAESQRRRVVRVTPRIEQERDWCAEQFNDPDAARVVNPYDGVLERAQPATEEELAWMTAVAQATAERRGLTLDEMPPIYLISQDAFRAMLCPLLLNPDSQEPNPLWYLDRLLQNIDPSWTPTVLGYLAQMQAAAWYLPVVYDRGGYVLLVNDRPLPRRYVDIFAHEIIHALQDAHFGLTNLDPEDAVSSDAAEAFVWVYEGDASFSPSNRAELEDLEALAEVEWGNAQKFEPPPVTLFDAFPSRVDLGREAYRLGRAMVEQVYEQEGYAGVNQLLSNPPPSTTQMIHAEALASDLRPTERAAICALTPAALGEAPCDGPNSDRLGEAFLRAFLAETTEDRQAAEAAANGWRGDLIRVVESEAEGDLVLWQLVFANQAEHDEAVTEMRNWLIARSGGWARAAIGAPVIAWNGGSVAIRVLDHARTLWLIVADDPAFADRVALSALEIAATPSWWED